MQNNTSAKKGEGMVRKYKIADVVFDAEFNYAYTADLCKNYVYEGQEPSTFFIKVTHQEIANEVADSEEVNYPEYLESLAVYRKFLAQLLPLGGTIIHSSAIAVDGKAYLFTAPSGTGKSTHASLWRELLGEKAVMVNDDKPVIRLIDGDFYVYGTPWNGKHSLDTNCSVKIKAICKLDRAKENSISRLESKEVLPMLLTQTLRPTNLGDYDKLLNLLQELMNRVDFYHLKCNKDISSAELSYKEMSKEN